jgi:hypothetical protein
MEQTKKIILFLLFLILMGTLVSGKSSFAETSIDDILNYTQTENDQKFKAHIKKIDNINRDITLEEVGCYKDLYTKYFLRKINPFSTQKDFDSGLTISQKSISNDYDKILKVVSTNGFEDFAKSFKKNYSANYEKVPLQQLAALALFAGYSYISISKFDENTINEIYLTYSPPMDRHNITGNFTEKEYQQNLTPPIKMDCGFTCGDGSTFKCGSVGYPTIKSPSLYNVFKIKENI